MRRALFLAILAVLFALPSIAQDSVTITSDPNDLSRPISTLLAQLRDREKISVTYEDPRYTNRADIQDVTSQVAKNLSPAQERFGPRILVPKGRALTFVYSARELHVSDGARVTIARMLREYQMLGGPTFTVLRDGSRFHVVPVDELGADGERMKQTSILETVISVPAARRHGSELLQAICDEVKHQTGYEIGVGPSAPGNDLWRYTTTEGITNQSARQALEHLLDSSAGPNTFDWDLYYDPGDKAYGLNFTYIGPARAAATE